MRMFFQTTLVALWLLIAPGTVWAQLPSSWTEPFDPVSIADNFYYVGSAGLSTFLVTTDEGHILIDAPLKENVALILENIRSLGFDPRDIRVHLLTHAHYDHVAGLADLVGETGGAVHVSAGDSSFVSEGRDFGFESEGYSPTVINFTVNHLEPIRLGDSELVPHITPGHTPGCTSWSGSVKIGGDSYSFMLVCSLSALSEYRLGGDDPTHPGQATEFCRSLEYLQTIESDIFLSNHGSFFDLAMKAEAKRTGNGLSFVDTSELERFLSNAATSIDKAREENGLQQCQASNR